MDAPTGEIRSHADFEADNDDEAITRALRDAGEQRIELWHNGRNIAAISGKDEPAELMIAPPAE